MGQAGEVRPVVLLFAPALLWLFAHVERTKWIRRGLGALGWSMVIEVLLITAQSYRDRAWHYNNQIDSCRPEYDEAYHRFMYQIHPLLDNARGTGAYFGVYDDPPGVSPVDCQLPPNPSE